MEKSKLISDNSFKGSNGIIIGKFMPPHRGHEYLAQFASSFVDKLWIFVCSLPGEPIPGEFRFRWMKSLFPQAEVVHIQEENPAANRKQDGAQKIWADTVLGHMTQKPDYIFASEEYGWEFARQLGAVFIPVDPSRDQFPISGSELRLRPFRNWHFIPPLVRGYFVKEIVVQCKGETDRAEEVIHKAALLLSTLYVPIYSDFYRKFVDSEKHPLNAISLQRAQQALTESLRNQAKFFLLRSWLEGAPETHQAPSLLILVNLVPTGQEAETDRPYSAAFEEIGNAPQVAVAITASIETAPHAIRDLILETYKELF